MVELSPADADALGIREGDRVEVGPGPVAGTGEAGNGDGRGTRVRGPVRLRAAIPSGTVFLAEGTSADQANRLTERTVEVKRVGPGSHEPSAVAVQVTPGIEGRSEMPASAPLPIPPREVS